MGHCPLFLFWQQMHRDQNEKNEAVIRHLTALVEPVLADYALELVEVQFRRESGGWVLRLIIYSPAGVTLEDCRRVSREVGLLLEVDDPIDHPYNLEVSSPGLDRPLRTVRDFERCMGRKVKVISREAVAERTEHEGVISGVDEDEVTLSIDADFVRIPLDIIAKAKQVIEF